MCGIFGAIRKSHSEIGEKRFKHLIRNLGIEAQVRGTHATGIAFNSTEGHLNIIKMACPAASFPFIQSIPNKIKAVIGHTRFTTQGSEKFNWNNHPFKGRAKNKLFAMAHNGMIWNDVGLKESYALPSTKIETDSYVIVQLIEQMGKINMDNVKAMAEELSGSFMLTFLEEKTNDLWLVKGDNPIYLVDFKELGLIVYASTKDIVENALKKDKMLYLYYKVAVDNSDTTRVDQLNIRDGDIYHYDYSKDKWNKGEFDDSLCFNYAYRYSYNWYDEWDDYYLNNTKVNKNRKNDRWTNRWINRWTNKWDTDRIKNDEYLLLTDTCPVKKHDPKSLNEERWEIISNVFGEECIVHYTENGEIDVLGCDDKHFVFNTYVAFESFIEEFDANGYDKAYEFVTKWLPDKMVTETAQ